MVNMYLQLQKRLLQDGGMDVKVTATDSDEYKVLEGHYDMTSQLDFSEVG